MRNLVKPLRAAAALSAATSPGRIAKYLKNNIGSLDTPSTDTLTELSRLSSTLHSTFTSTLQSNNSPDTLCALLEHLTQRHQTKKLSKPLFTQFLDQVSSQLVSKGIAQFSPHHYSQLIRTLASLPSLACQDTQRTLMDQYYAQELAHRLVGRLELLPKQDLPELLLLFSNSTASKSNESSCSDLYKEILLTLHYSQSHHYSRSQHFSHSQNFSHSQHFSHSHEDYSHSQYHSHSWSHARNLSRSHSRRHNTYTPKQLCKLCLGFARLGHLGSARLCDQLCAQIGNVLNELDVIDQIRVYLALAETKRESARSLRVRVLGLVKQNLPKASSSQLLHAFGFLVGLGVGRKEYVRVLSLSLRERLQCNRLSPCETAVLLEIVADSKLWKTAMFRSLVQYGARSPGSFARLEPAKMHDILSRYEEGSVFARPLSEVGKTR